MIREVMKYIDASFCAEAALILFLLVFLAVSMRAMLTRKSVINQHAIIPLSDGTEVTRS